MRLRLLIPFIVLSLTAACELTQPQLPGLDEGGLTPVPLTVATPDRRPPPRGPGDEAPPNRADNQPPPGSGDQHPPDDPDDPHPLSDPNAPRSPEDQARFLQQEAENLVSQGEFKKLRQDAVEIKALKVSLEGDSICEEWVSSWTVQGMPENVRKNIDTLIKGMGEIDYQVTALDNGIRSDATSSNPTIKQALQAHVLEMDEWLREAPLMGADIVHPIYKKMLEARGEISLEKTLHDTGVRSDKVAKDPAMVELIHAHAALLLHYLSAGPESVAKCTDLKAGETALVSK